MSTSVTSVTNHFPSAENGFSTTTSASVSSGATTVQLNSVAGYDNGEVVVFVIDPTDATKKQTFTGVIDTAGTQVTSVVWTAGTNTAHALGATVVDYATATHISMISKGLMVEHKQTGAHGAVTADSIAVSGVSTLTGATTITGALTVKSYNGWIYPTSTWTYASSTTFTVPGDVTSQFPVGTKIKLTQTTAKYFYVTGSSYGAPNTTVTVTAGSDYTIANAAITSPALSYDASPQGFPQWFNHVCAFSNLTEGNATDTSRFKMNGSEVIFRIDFIFGSTTSISGSTSLTLPVTMSSSWSGSSFLGNVLLRDAGTAEYNGTAEVSSSTLAIIYKDNVSGTNVIKTTLSSTVPFTWGTGDGISGILTYQAA